MSVEDAVEDMKYLASPQHGLMTLRGKLYISGGGGGGPIKQNIAEKIAGKLCTSAFWKQWTCLCVDKTTAVWILFNGSMSDKNDENCICHSEAF